MLDIYCINCGLAYNAYKVMLLWNNERFAECREGYGHTWSRVRDDGLAESYINNNPENVERRTT